MTPAPISVERLRELLAVMTGSDPNRMTDFPGGCDCQECGCVFIGGDGHEYCAQCEAKRQLLAALPEALPALLHQLAEREAECERLAEIEHHVWHMLDEADDDGESIRIARDNPDHLALDALLPEDHP